MGATEPVSSALWYMEPRKVQLRQRALPPLPPGHARVRMLYSAISRGTERLVFNGLVPASEWQSMRAPMQAGEFPFPVKYGYCAVGRVEEGPGVLLGRTVFCLHPHQDVFDAAIDQLAMVPDSVPPRRATLAANMETALNAVWDAGAGPADRVAIVGAGVVGLLIGYVTARLPGANVKIYDINAERRPLIERLGCSYGAPSEITADADVVFHTSGTAAGLNAAIAAAGFEGRIVELSWFGDGHVSILLGGAFHSRRLALVSSQVGHVSPGRRPRWSYRRRMDAALSLLADGVLDALITREIPFERAPEYLPEILSEQVGPLAPVLRYAQAPET